MLSEPGFWVIIVGAVLLTFGILGLVFARDKEEAINPDSGPPVQHLQMAVLPKPLDSSRPNEGEEKNHREHARPGI